MKKILFTLCLTLLAFGAIAQSPVSFNAKAGVGVSNLWGKNSDGHIKAAYKLGVGMEYAFSTTWALRPSLNFVAKGSQDEEKGVGKVIVNALYLELPILAAARIPIGERSNIVLTAGPYLAYGVGGRTTIDIDEKQIPSSTGFVTFGGKTKVDTFGDIGKGNLGCERFDAGVGLGVAFEYGKITIGAESQLGLVNMGSSELKDASEQMGLGTFSSKNFSAFLSVGYNF